MTLDQAIRILTLEAKYDDDRYNPNLNGAIKVAIEALKRVNAVRKDGVFVGSGLLPGETED